MIEAELLVAGRYAAILTPFDCPSLGLVCGIRTISDFAVWVVPDTHILNPEALGRVHSCVRQLTALELLGALECLSKAGPLALASDEAEREMTDLREKVPGGIEVELLLCSHLNRPRSIEKIFDLLTTQGTSHLAYPLYMLISELNRFERGLFLNEVPDLSGCFDKKSKAPSFQELISFVDLTREIEISKRGYGESDREAQLKGICSDGLYREVATVHAGLNEAFEEIRRDFPNFAEVTEFLQAQVELGLRRRTRAQSWQPILLVGPPGCGKSAYCRRVSEILENDYFETDLSHLHGRFELVGLHPSWKGASAGFLANSLIKSRYINPVIFFDEIDKANSRHQDGSLMASLLTLLEPDSARKYVDQFLRVGMRADKILWFFAANDVGVIPGPALSRLQVFLVQQPTAFEQEHIIRRMYEHLAESSDLKDTIDPKIQPAVVDSLISNSVREVRLRLQLAIANAALRLRGTSHQITLISDDVPVIGAGREIDTSAHRVLH